MSQAAKMKSFFLFDVFFFPFFAVKLSTAHPPNQVTICFLTKSTVAFAPSDVLWGTAAWPRRRTARYTACVGATARYTPRKGSRPEKWPPSPEL